MKETVAKGVHQQLRVSALKKKTLEQRARFGLGAPWNIPEER